MRFHKSKLLSISKQIEAEKPITPKEINYLLSFKKNPTDNYIVSVLKQLALPFSLILGFLIAVNPGYFEGMVNRFPSWSNLTPQELAGLNYLWNILGEPVEKINIFYHIPNIVLYSVSFFGLKKLFESLQKHTWKDRVRKAKSKLKNQISKGRVNLSLAKGHSLLFVGGGDYIATQFVLNHKESNAVTISHNRPTHTRFWNYYDVTTLYEDLKNVMIRCDAQTCGEYIFFPVKDNEIFLPGPKSYDLSPHKLDILCQDIRMIEKEMGWNPKRIIVIGDTFHSSFVQSEDNAKVVPKSQETITVKTIAKRYKPVTILDPSDVVISNIIDIANGRTILFRATKEGLKEYKRRFYDRLKILGYKQSKTKKGVLTIGYDLFEDQTEQQTLSRSVNDYFPIVLSKAVRDSLIRNGYTENEFLYVPQLVLQKLKQLARQQ